MAKFELRFLCDSEDGSYIKVNVFKDYDRNVSDIIDIIIDADGHKNSVVLDKSTAIKFAKTLRTEINKITESEVKNV